MIRSDLQELCEETLKCVDRLDGDAIDLLGQVYIQHLLRKLVLAVGELQKDTDDKATELRKLRTWQQLHAGDTMSLSNELDAAREEINELWMQCKDKE